ncbi:ATP-dependent helicase HrpB [soil metagenome]
MRRVAPLPIDPSIPEIVAQLRAQRTLVLVAEPGAGKTTRVPPAILAAGDLLSPKHPNLVMLQPRRVAARAAAERIADENRWTLGQQVGYHVRFDRKLTRDTRLRVVTEGILTRQLLDDPFLEGIGAVVLDEFHERSIHTDVAIALLREIRQSVRADLMLIVMSATLEAEPVSKFLGDAPIIRVPGRTFPVEISHEQKLGVHLTDQIVNTVRNRNEPGDVLIFLPGAPEIRRVMRELEPLAASQNDLVLPLHGSLASDEQTRALRPAPNGQRKIICATNIAETSLTIDGVRVVIDSGLARIVGYDARRGRDRLELKRSSKASAIQRAGRAGRTAAGRCIRLWSAKEYHESPDFELPEIQRVDLAGTVLALHAWGHADPRKFPWFQPPPEATIAAAEKLLAVLGALDSSADGRITELGRKMLSMPAHPRVARMLVAAADSGLLAEGAAIAAIVSEKDFLDDDSPALRGSSDLLVRIPRLSQPNARPVARLRDELMRIGKRLRTGTPPPGDREEALLKLILLAYPDRVARRRAADPGAATMVGGGGVRLDRQSVVHDWEFFVAADARHDERNPAQQATVRLASGIKPEWLEELFPQAVHRTKAVRFDESRGKVVAENIVAYHDLVLRSDPNAIVDPQDIERALVETLATSERATQMVEADSQIASMLKRFAFLEHALPPHLWPRVGWPQIANEELVRGACAGASSVQQIKENLGHVLHAKLQHAHRKALEDYAPEEVVVPTGNQIKLDWSAATIQPLRGPVLAVRLQEMFGMTETPRVAGGTVPVILHLLGPNYRPVQITDDLKSFWSTTYFQVRKDLRVRYPKHSWPEDPLTAPPQAKGSRRKG